MRSDQVNLLQDESAPAHASTPTPSSVVTSPRDDSIVHRPADNRITFIDNARAIGIVLVVLGHAPALPALASNLIFAFHMPLFFFLSGLVVSADRLNMSTTHRAILLTRTLLLPYVFYFFIAYVYWLVAKRHGLRATEFELLTWWNPLIGLLDGSADDLYVDVVLWFFPCLFVTAIAHHMVCKFVPTSVAAVILAIVTLGFVLTHDATSFRWWWSADCAIVAVGFYAFGAACNDWLKRRKPHRGPLNMVTAVLGTAACVALTQVNGHVDLNHLAFGVIPALYVPMAITGIAAALAVSMLLPPSTLARWLSINTLVIFPLHFLMFSLFTGIAIELFGLSVNFKEATAWTSALYAGVALLMCWPVAMVLHRCFPWLFHQGHAPPRKSLAPAAET
jgi:acyltransferase